MRWPLEPLQPLQQTQLQPPFGQSVASLCHPWFTTTNVSYRFPIFETSATALCSTTGYPRLVVFSGPLTHMGHKCNVQKWTDSQALIFFALVIPFFAGPQISPRKALAFCRRGIVDSTHPWVYFNTIPFQEMFIPAVYPIASLNRDLTTTVDRSHQWCRAQQQTIAHDTSQYWGISTYIFMLAVFNGVFIFYGMF